MPEAKSLILTYLKTRPCDLWWEDSKRDAEESRKCKRITEYTYWPSVLTWVTADACASRK